MSQSVTPDELHSTHSNDVEKQSSAIQQETPIVQDWDGPDDPENPINWPGWKKAYHTGASAVLGFAVTCGSALITPSVTSISEEFNVSLTAAILTLSLYVFGLALGPVLAAPVSETL